MIDALSSPPYEGGVAAASADGVVLSIPNLNALLSADFQQLSNLLGEAAFAAYLLAYDTASTESRIAVMALSEPGALATGFQLAEGDDKKKKKKPPVRRLTARSIIYAPHGKDQTAAEIAVGDKTLFGLRFDVPPQEAIDYFRRKQVLPADKFYELESEAKAGAFAIGKVYETDVTSALQNELIAALENGTPQQQVIKNLKEILAGAGHKELGDAHLETVFRTTTQMAYGVGRRTAQEEAADYLPIWEYAAVGDDRTRPTHMALDGLQYPANHPFWQSYYPPWDFRCRCSVIPIFDYRSGYDRSKPNGRADLDFDSDGLPTRAAVDGQVVKINPTKFQGVPQQANLGQVLKSAAARALDARKN